MRIVRLANYVAPASGGLRTALRELGAGYLAAGHEPVLVIPGPRPGREYTRQGLVITVPGVIVPGTGGYRAITTRRPLRRLLGRAVPGGRCAMMPACEAAPGSEPGSWPVTRFAALGDSVTLGMGDPMPQGGWRGWAALLAGSLAPPDRVELSNLALSGALIRDVAGDQLEQAVALAPTHASVLVGMNDTLRGTFDLGAITADLEQILATLERTGALVLTASLPDPGLLLRIPGSLRRPLARRAHAINGVLGRLAEHYQVVHVDVAAHPAIYDKRMWGVDRLHPSERGHRWLARLFAMRLAELGVPPHALPDLEPTNPEPSAWEQAHWMATKGTGWVVRRSRDLVPRLLQLAAKEWWHDRRGRDSGRELIALDPGEP